MLACSTRSETRPWRETCKGRLDDEQRPAQSGTAGAATKSAAVLPFNLPLLALSVSLLPLEVEQRRVLIDALFKAVRVRGLHVSDQPLTGQV
jgi:hypothetical protein